MMNKVFINDRPVFLFTKKKPLNATCDFTLQYSTNAALKKTLKSFEANQGIKSLGIEFDSEKQKKDAFFKLYKVIEAAGGIVKNTDNKLLFIYRHGKWDLPKGKIEKGEKEKHAAVREVQEECGIIELRLNAKFMETYHTYQIKGKDVLKISHWYFMTYSGNTQKLIPQLEEGITKAQWMTEAQVKKAMKNAYASIVEAMQIYFH